MYVFFSALMHRYLIKVYGGSGCPMRIIFDKLLKNKTFVA
jgi:hypothetical protein